MFYQINKTIAAASFSTYFLLYDFIWTNYRWRHYHLPYLIRSFERSFDGFYPFRCAFKDIIDKKPRDVYRKFIN